MCFGLAPGFIVEEDLEATLEDALAAQEGGEDSDAAAPSFAEDEPADGAALTGDAARGPDRHGGGPN
jgi:hypothetical protein